MSTELYANDFWKENQVTTHDIKALLELEKMATPGPWVNRPSGVVQQSNDKIPTIIFWDDESKFKGDYPFIAALRNSAKEILEENLRMRDAIGRETAKEE